MPRITKIYTRRGDGGTTRLGAGRKVSKASPRVEVYGTVDELSSAIGVALSAGLGLEIAEALRRIQNELFNLGTELCFEEGDKQGRELPRIEQRHVDELERMLDRLTEAVGPLENFILPGGSAGAASLHLARTICRRAERALVALAEREPIAPLAVTYLNRLSDALFVMARYENHERGIAETYWDSRNG